MKASVRALAGVRARARRSGRLPRAPDAGRQLRDVARHSATATAQLTYGGAPSTTRALISTRAVEHAAAGFSERRGGAERLLAVQLGPRVLARQGLQGTFNGFRIIDVDDPRRPVELVDYESCGTVGQGDVVVWGSVLVRSWTSTPAPRARAATARPSRPASRASTSSTSPIRANPELDASIDLACGSHTATARARPEQPPPARLRHAVERGLRGPRHRRGSAQPARSVRDLIGFEQADPKRPTACGRARPTRASPATTPASSSAGPRRSRAPAASASPSGASAARRAARSTTRGSSTTS